MKFTKSLLSAVLLFAAFPLTLSAALQLSADSLSFPPAYVGNNSVMTVMATNTGNVDLIVIVMTSGHIWTVSPSSFSLGSGDQMPVTVMFQPTFEHEFTGTVEFFSSDETNPRDSVFVTGTGCKPVVAPPAPVLRDAASPVALYFSIPSDANGEAAEYAVEYSSDGFQTSQYLPSPSDREGETYASAWEWGVLNSGAMTGLQAETPYSVRLHARDCTGAEAVGLFAAMATRPEIIVDNTPQLTIKVIDANTVRLDWDPLILDLDHVPLPNSGWVVYYGTDGSTLDSVVGFVNGGSLTLNISGLNPVGYFALEPLVSGVNDPPNPFLSWPPDGATIGGPNSVVLQDLLHELDWDSFRVEIDSAGFPVLLASNLTDQVYFGGSAGAFVDFNYVPPGPHIITATIVDRLNRSFSSAISVVVVPEPYAEWTSLFDSGTNTFTFTATNIEGMVGGMADVLWTTSGAGERYGSPMSFGWSPAMGDPVIVRSYPISQNKVLSARGEWFANDTEHGSGPMAAPADPIAPPKNLSHFTIDCCDLTIRTSGDSRYRYGTNAKKAKEVALGPTATCDEANFSIKAKIEVEFTLCYREETPPPTLTYGVDMKGSEETEDVDCAGNPASSYTAVPGTKKNFDHENSHKPPQTRSFAGDHYAKTSSRAGGLDKNLARYDWTQKSCTSPCLDCGKTYTISWIHEFSAPAAFANAKNAYKTQIGRGKRVKGQYQFLASCFPQCFDAQNPMDARCCKTVDLNWNVVCCPKPHAGKIEVTAPAFAAPVAVTDLTTCALATE